MNDTVLIGKAKELQIAALLTEMGFYVYIPLIDKGFDLVFTNEKGKQFIPVQVKYREADPALGLTKKDINRFEGRDRGGDVLLAFIIGGTDRRSIWLLPFRDWLDKAEDNSRKDKVVFVSIGRNRAWLEKYLAENSREALNSLFQT